MDGEKNLNNAAGENTGAAESKDENGGGGDFSKAFEMLEGMLSTEEGQKQISDIISAFSGGSASGGSSENGGKGAQSQGRNMPFGADGIMNMLSGQNSRGAAFLEALKPFLRKERREKIDTAIKLTQAAALMKQLGFLKQGGGKHL